MAGRAKYQIPPRYKCTLPLPPPPPPPPRRSLIARCSLFSALFCFVLFSRFRVRARRAPLDVPPSSVLGLLALGYNVCRSLVCFRLALALPSPSITHTGYWHRSRLRSRPHASHRIVSPAAPPSSHRPTHSSPLPSLARPSHALLQTPHPRVPPPLRSSLVYHLSSILFAFGPRSLDTRRVLVTVI